MKEKITLYGDNCIMCPRYNANTDEELKELQTVLERYKTEYELLAY